MNEDTLFRITKNKALNGENVIKLHTIKVIRGQ